MSKKPDKPNRTPTVGDASKDARALQAAHLRKLRKEHAAACIKRGAKITTRRQARREAGLEDDKQPTPDVRAALEQLARSLRGSRIMIEDVIRRNEKAASQGIQSWTPERERKMWVDWYSRDYKKAVRLAARDKRLPAPPLPAATLRESYDGLERWCRDSLKVTGPPVRGDNIPGDVVTAAVAVAEYQTSKGTIRRKVKKGLLHDYRPPGAPINATLVLSRAELAHFFARK